MPELPDSLGRYFACLYAYGPQRELLATLFGIEREITTSLRPGLDHQVAHARLQWWREELARCGQGRAAHPLTRSLQSIAPGHPALDQLSGLVDTCVWDLAGATFETRRELTAYCERWAAAMICPLLASGTREALGMGAALRELELISALASESRAGRLRVPLDELERIAATPQALGSPPWPAPLSKLVGGRHEALRETLGRGCNSFAPREQLTLRGMLVWAALVARLSRRAQSSLPHVPRQQRLDGVADAWFAWREARRATLGRFRLE